MQTLQSDPYAARPGQTVDTGPGPVLGQIGNVFGQAPNLQQKLAVAEANRQAAADAQLGTLAINTGAVDPQTMRAYLANGGDVAKLGQTLRLTGYLNGGPTSQQGTNASYGLGQGNTTLDWQNRALGRDITKTGADADITAAHDVMPVQRPDGSVGYVSKAAVLNGQPAAPILSPEQAKGALASHTYLPQQGDAAPAPSSPGVATVGPITVTSPAGATATGPGGGAASSAPAIGSVFASPSAASAPASSGAASPVASGAAPALGSVFAPSFAASSPVDAGAPIAAPASGGAFSNLNALAGPRSGGSAASLPGGAFPNLAALSPSTAAVMSPVGSLNAVSAGAAAPVNTTGQPNGAVGGGDSSIGAPSTSSQPAPAPNSSAGRFAALTPEQQQFIGAAAPPQKLDLKQIGTDALGNPAYGIFDPTTGTVKPVVPQGAAPGAPAAAGPGPSATDAMGGLHGADYLKTLPPQYHGLIVGIAEGRTPPPPATTRNGKPNPVLALVEQYDPSFDASNAQARYALRKDFESGQTSKDIVSMNTDLGHLNDFAEGAKSLGNGGIQPLNQLENGFASTFKGNGKTATTITNLKSLQNTLADEYIRYVTGGNGGEGDREKVAALFDPDKSSTAQMLTATNTLAEAMSRKTDALQSKWQTGMQADPFPILNPQSQAILEQMKIGAAAPPVELAPGVQPAPVRSAADTANGVPLPRAGEVRTGPDGKPYVFKGGASSTVPWNSRSLWAPVPTGAQ